MPEINRREWDAWLAGIPTAHLLQTGAWGELKAAFGWQPVRWIDKLSHAKYGAQILFRRLPLGFSFAYLARGPVLADAGESINWNQLWLDLDNICRAHRAAFLKIEPDVWEDLSAQLPIPPGVVPSHHAIQPPRTVLIDLTAAEDEILGRMKQKTRYNIHLAEKKGVQVHTSDDLSTFFHLISITGARDSFGVHSRSYYQKAYDLFASQEACQLFQADYQGEPLAALMVFLSGSRAWYLYGASGDAHREKMPTYLLQWEAMRWAKVHGARQYDLYGVPDVPQTELEEQFLNRSDGLWGVYRFKRGFGGVIQRAVGPWDRIYRPLIYRAYDIWMNRSRGVD